MTTLLVLVAAVLASAIAVAWSVLGYTVTAEDCAAEREMELDNDYFLDEENGVDKRGVGGR